MQPDSAVKKVLVYRIGSLGDTVVALPCLHLIARVYPNAERRLLTNFPVHVKAPAAAAILNGSDLVHSYMRYNIGTRNPLELLRLALEIRRFQPDVLIYLMPVRSQQAVHRDQNFFRFAAGVKRIIGIPADNGLQQRPDPKTGLFEAEASRLARTVAALGDASTGDLTNWNLRLTGAEKDSAVRALGQLSGRPLIVCGPGTKMQAKDWGRDNWRTLLSQLHVRYPGYALAMIGAREDDEVSEYASRDWQGGKINLCGRLSPRETAAVLEHASVFLGPDSGPMHLAACVGVPCVIAFSARGCPGVWYPAGAGHQIIYHQVSCWGCNLETCTVEARRCLTSITVDEMAGAVHNVLTRNVLASNVSAFHDPDSSTLTRLIHTD